MDETLRPGLEYEFSYTVPENKTVPHLYPEAELFGEMPKVFATGFLVGLVEWACAEALKPYLDWPNELTVGTRIDISHTAPTPPGLTITVKVKLTEREGPRFKFAVSASRKVTLTCKLPCVRRRRTGGVITCPLIRTTCNVQKCVERWFTGTASW